MVQMVFFDIGDVLFDEDVPHLWLFHALLLTLRRSGKTVHWDEFNATRKMLAACGPNPEAAIKGALAAFCVNEAETETLWARARAQYAEMRRPRPFGLLLDDITPVLRDLRADFRLGVIANQHPPVAQALADYGIAPLFDVVVISEIVNLFKPDPAIFQHALQEANLQADETLFVGDRPDSDIRPAKALGMKTVRLRRGVQYALYNPDGVEFRPDATVTQVSELAAAVRRVAQGEKKQ